MLLSIGSPANAQDAEFGKDVWLGQANCADCHGWFGDGNAEDPRSPRGANLRETSLDKELLIEVILCGIPGTSMPHFDSRAYTDDRCYGLTRADLDGSAPPTGSTALTRRHATGLANFILEYLVGKGEPTQEECVALLGPDSSRCSKLTN
jgi:hypothetical protein